MPQSRTRPPLVQYLAPILAGIILFAEASVCLGQDQLTATTTVRTHSPRQTYESFLSLTRDLEAALLEYRQNRTEQVYSRISRIAREFRLLIDLSSVPEASRRKQGVATSIYLLDIFGRIDPPPVHEVPAEDNFDARPDMPASWRVPHTPFSINRINAGPREGEFLFSGRTVETAPRFYREVRNLPLRSRLPISSWNQTIIQLSGPMIPAGVVSATPDVLKKSWLDTPAWKILGIILLVILATILVLALYRVIAWRRPNDTLLNFCSHLPVPVAIIFIVTALEYFSAVEVNITGTFSTIFLFTATVLKYLAVAWLFWVAVVIAVELIIRSPRIPDQSLDASLFRLTGRILGVAGVVAILAYAANRLGVPVVSLIAGLGIGGLAVALAIRPTLENLIGGLILYADRPVRVGDFCSFNNYMGTVESIGVRSTTVRGLDRTLISVPNAKFADMEIINWAHCDQMLIETTIGLRYETQPDQLRYVLAKLREMFCAHPKIDTETVRVRFAKHGASSLDIDIRVYACTREWNEYYAIQEDVFLRMNEIVMQAGTGFAFPSRTLYVGRDKGLHPERSGAAEEAVDAWRKSGKLPFPKMSPSRLNELADTLDYPPYGSSDALSPESEESAERLSAETEAEPSDETGRPPGVDGSPDSKK